MADVILGDGVTVLVEAPTVPIITMEPPTSPEVVVVPVAGLPGTDGQDGADSTVPGPPGTTSWAGITDKPATFAPAAHTHPEADITGLTADLASKAPLADMTTALDYLNGLATAQGNAISALGTSKADAAATTTALAGKADAAATTTALAGKAATVHTHAQTDVTGLTASITAVTGDQQASVAASPAAGAQSFTGFAIATYGAYRLTLTSNISIAATAMPVVPAGKTASLLMRFMQDATGSRTLTLTGFLRAAGTSPVLSTTAAATDLVRFTYDGANWWIESFIKGGA